MRYIYNSEMYGQQAVETSADQAWSGLRVERYQLPAMQIPAHYHEHHVLLLHQGNQLVRSHRQSGSRVEEAFFRAGDAGLYPGGEYGPLGWDGPTDLIHLHLDAGALEAQARQQLELTHFALRDRFRFEDGLLTQLGRQLLLAANGQHALGRLYIESLTTALSFHLIAHHATYERRIAVAGPQLSAGVLARIEAYVEAACQQPITLAELADLANLSVFHFARRFKATTGRSPYQYVLEWKIQRARQLLRADQLPIADISDILGFASPAHFATAFKRAVGQSPRAFRQA